MDLLSQTSIAAGPPQGLTIVSFAPSHRSTGRFDIRSEARPRGATFRRRKHGNPPFDKLVARGPAGHRTKSYRELLS